MRFACGTIALMPAYLIFACLMPLTFARAQNQAVDDLKGKIFDARMVKDTFAAGLKFCADSTATTSTSWVAIASSLSKSTIARWKT